MPEVPGDWWQSWLDRAHLVWGQLQALFGGNLVNQASLIDSVRGAIDRVA